MKWVNWFHFVILVGGPLVILIECMIFLSALLDVLKMSMSTVFLRAQLDSAILQKIPQTLLSVLFWKPKNTFTQTLIRFVQVTKRTVLG